MKLQNVIPQETGDLSRSTNNNNDSICIPTQLLSILNRALSTRRKGKTNQRRITDLVIAPEDCLSDEHLRKI